MGRFFVSYRRRDIGYAGWINEILMFHLTAERMFFDVERLRAGDNFDQQLDEELDLCDAMVVVIGPAWREEGQRSGVRRLHEPRDYVRREVGRALERDIPVIPVRVGDTPLPAAAELPEQLRSLLSRQAVELSDESFRHEVRRLLVSRLREIPTRKPGQRTEEPTCVLSPVHADADSLSPETAGAFAFLWLAETFSIGREPGLRLRLSRSLLK